MDAELERKLREQIDRSEIHRTMLRYARGLDRLDNRLARSCYWDDAIEDHGQFVGMPDDFIQYADRTTLMFEAVQHGILNHMCDLQGDDAYCETYFQFTGVTAGDGPNFVSTGRYVDHFQKRPGANGTEWRIANRVAIIESQMDVPKSAIMGQIAPSYTADEPCQARRDRTDVSYHRPPTPRRPKM
ncbi:MAG: nuclear transport factor 2 family protein [Novosphingobium sp.]